MSSRVLQSGDPRDVGPMPLRTVGPEPAGAVFAAGGARLSLEADRMEARLREAHASGLREGEASGRSHAAAELQPLMERMGRSIAEIGALRARLRREAEQDLIRLSLAIARRILRREMAVDPDALRGLVRVALEKLESQEISRASVHPAQAAVVAACLQQLGTREVEVLPDPSCEPGTVRLETPRGCLDASVESQLQEIERGLVDQLRKRV